MERYKIKVAVYILLMKGSEILLARRFNTGWQDGNYGLPAGHLEPNETIKQGAIREMQEEVGITIKSEDVEYIHTMHRMNRYIDLFFVCSNWEGTPKITEADKCDDVQWFSLDSLPENIIPSVRHAILQYKNGVTFSEFDVEEK